jgi:TolA-binding protein
MISRFMSSESQPPDHQGAQRGADLYDLLAWLEVNKTKVATAAVLLLGVGFAVATIRYLKQQKEAKASAELLALKPTLSPQTNVPPAQPSAFLKVAEQFPGTHAGERAQFFAAAALFTDGKYADAEREFTRYSREHPDSPWAAEAAYGAATALEAQNKLTEAQAAYQNVSAAYANSTVADEAKLGLARIYQLQKQPAQALRIYNELLAPRPGAQPGEVGNQNAFLARESLLHANPALDTNTPPPVQISAPATGTNNTAASSGTNAAPGTLQPASTNGAAK